LRRAEFPALSVVNITPDLKSMKKIIIAEDENIVALELTLGLKKLGYMVKSVSSGKELIQQSLKTRPDIVITDINLKDKVSGIDAINEIRKSLKCKVFAFTGFNDNDSMMKFREMNLDGVFKKPVTADEIHQYLVSTPVAGE
jgi:DNA-binding NarL/FixJ family response regulator